MSVVEFNISPYLALGNIEGEYIPLFPDKYLQPTSSCQIQ